MTGIRLPSRRPLPKTGGFAHAQAEVVAKQIAAEVAGGGTPRRFAGEGAWLMETGGRRGVLVRGDFYAASGRPAKVLGPSMAWHFAVLFEHRWLGQMAGA